MLQFIDGFDHYVSADMGKKWDSVAGGTTYSIGASGRFGSQGLYAHDGFFATKVLKRNPTFIAGFAFRLRDIPADTTRVVFAFTDGGSPQLELRVSSLGVLYVTRAGTALDGASAATALQAGSYYFIEFKAKVSASAASGDVVVKVAGVAAITVPAGTNCQATANASADGFVLGPGSGGVLHSTTIDWDYDDLYVLDDQGAVNADFIGDQRVEVLWPNGAGAHTDFAVAGSAPAATNWQSVNEASEDGDVSYVASPTPGAKDTYTYTDLSTTPTSVAAVQINFVCRKDDAGTRIGAGLVRSGGNDFEGVQFGIGDTYALSRAVFEKNPGTNAAWTPTDVNSLEAGIVLVA